MRRLRAIASARPAQLFERRAADVDSLKDSLDRKFTIENAIATPGPRCSPDFLRSS